MKKKQYKTLSINTLYCIIDGFLGDNFLNAKSLRSKIRPLLPTSEDAANEYLLHISGTTEKRHIFSIPSVLVSTLKPSTSKV